MKTTYVHATHSVVDWCAFALWQGGELVRALSVSPDQGVQEDIGDKLPFEAPYWDGTFAIEDEFEDDAPYPLPFHPLELSEAALLAILGFQFEGYAIAHGTGNCGGRHIAVGAQSRSRRSTHVLRWGYGGVGA